MSTSCKPSCSLTQPTYSVLKRIPNPPPHKCESTPRQATTSKRGMSFALSTSTHDAYSGVAELGDTARRFNRPWQHVEAAKANHLLPRLPFREGWHGDAFTTEYNDTYHPPHPPESARALRADWTMRPQKRCIRPPNTAREPDNAAAVYDCMLENQHKRVLTPHERLIKQIAFEDRALTMWLQQNDVTLTKTTRKNAHKNSKRKRRKPQESTV